MKNKTVYIKLFCKQKPLLKNAYASFCFAKRNISLVKFLKLFKRKVYYGVDIQGERAGYEGVAGEGDGEGVERVRSRCIRL